MKTGCSMYYVFSCHQSSPLLSISSPPHFFLSLLPSSHSTQTLSNNPSSFVLEWRSNAFHLCVSVLGLQGQGLPLFIHSPPHSTSTLFQQNPKSGSTQHEGLRSLSMLGPLLALGGEGEVNQGLRLLQPGQ